ncbi:MAG: alpha/beta hydrolase family protein [Phycisphaeraceae bacterium]
MERIARIVLPLAVSVLIAVPAVAQADPPPTPPAQRASGPGGLDYAYRGVSVTRYGEGAEGYWVFEPRGVDKTKPLPIVGFVHGLNATSYGTSWLWIRHLVQKGNLVVYPQYQEGLLLDPKRFTGRSADAIAEAIERFDGKQHALADKDRFAMVGHSLGGAIIANLAARHLHYGLPKPKALMPVQPGDVRAESGLGAFFPSLIEDHRTIPAGTLMLVIATEDDNIVGQGVAKAIYRAAERVGKDDKDYVLIGPDRHGRPTLPAGHLMAWAYIDSDGKARANAYDYALWRWFDALTAAAFGEDEHRAIALGNTPEQRDLGKWSDGTPVRPPKVTDQP